MRRGMFRMAFGALFAGGLLIPRAVASAQACCSVTSIDQRSGVVSAKESATGRAFQFTFGAGKLVGSLRLGQPVYANFKTNQVSLDGKTVCCSVLSGSTGSGGRMPESGSQQPGARPTVASKGGQQPQPTPDIKPTEDTTEGAIRGSTAAKTPTSVPAKAPRPLLAEYKVLRQRALGLRPLIHASNASQAQKAKADWTVFLRDLESWASRYKVKLVWHSVTRGVGVGGAAPPNLPPLDCPDISSVGSDPGGESEEPSDPSQAGMDTTPNDFGNSGGCYLQKKSYVEQRGWTCEYVCVPSDIPTWGGSPSKE